MYTHPEKKDGELLTSVAKPGVVSMTIAYEYDISSQRILKKIRKTTYGSHSQKQIIMSTIARRAYPHRANKTDSLPSDLLPLALASCRIMGVQMRAT
jgi:hypothetical protein